MSSKSIYNPRAKKLATQGILVVGYRRFLGLGAHFWFMKAKIIVTPKKAVLDPQGKTVQNALEHIGFKGLKDVRIGKYIEIELEGTDRETALQSIKEAAHKILSNPVIEDYTVEIQ